MVTAVLPTESAAPSRDPLRLVPIVANLLPPEIAKRRQVRKVRRRVISAFALVVVLMASWYGFASYQTMEAQAALDRVEGETKVVIAQQGLYTELVTVQAESARIDGQLGTLMATDLRWSSVLIGLLQAAPKGVDLGGVAAALDDAAAADGATPAATPGEEKIGTISLTGLANDKAAIADYVEKIDKLPGLGNTLITSVATAEERFQFNLEAEINASALGGRFTTATPDPAPAAASPVPSPSQAGVG